MATMAEGEFELINRIAQIVGPADIPAGIGDDAAILDLGGPDLVLATVDMQVQDIHFRLNPYHLELLGRRALAVNLSDIAAMGGTATYALVSLALPDGATGETVDALYRGLTAEGREFGVEVVGGNITRTPGPLAIDVCVFGRVPRGEEVLRSGALPGDLLAVTGTLGGATARLASIELAWEEGDHVPAPALPVPRLAAGRALARNHLVHAMLDVSDGVAGDVRHLCEASGTGALIRPHLLPIAEDTRLRAAELGLDATELALTGGEDYELLVALPPWNKLAARQTIAPVPLTVIGEITPGREIAVEDVECHRTPLIATGWRHF